MNVVEAHDVNFVDNMEDRLHIRALCVLIVPPKNKAQSIEPAQASMKTPYCSRTAHRRLYERPKLAYAVPRPIRVVFASLRRTIIVPDGKIWEDDVTAVTCHIDKGRRDAPTNILVLQRAAG